MFKPLLFVLVPCCLYALALSKDTIYSRQYMDIPSLTDTILVNAASDTIKIDSMSVKVVESHVSVFDLTFCFVRGSCYQFGANVGGLVLRQAFVVLPQTALAIRRSDVCLDMCCICPVFKAPAVTGLNDPLVVMLYFYSNSGTDSITVVSIQKITSMAIKNNPPVKAKITRKGNPSVYNLKGQAVTDNKVTSVEINKGDMQVKISK